MTRPVLTRKDPSEEAIQTAFFQWVLLFCPDDVICFAVLNGGDMHPDTDGRLKAMGVVDGADVVVILPGSSVGLIKFKTDKDRLTREQRHFRDRCEAIGARYAICRDSTVAIERVTAWAERARYDLPTPLREAAE